MIKGNSGVGLSHTISMGPSELLVFSGSKKSIPRMGDYHANLKKHVKYVAPGPATYNLPSFLDNYKKEFSNLPGLKKNPRISFAHKDPPTRFYEYEMLKVNLNTESPGPMAPYVDISKPTFDRINALQAEKRKVSPEIGSKMEFKVEEPEAGTFGKDKRFHVPKKDQ